MNYLCRESQQLQLVITERTRGRETERVTDVECEKEQKQKNR